MHEQFMDYFVASFSSLTPDECGLMIRMHAVGAMAHCIHATWQLSRALDPEYWDLRPDYSLALETNCFQDRPIVFFVSDSGAEFPADFARGPGKNFDPFAQAHDHLDEEPADLPVDEQPDKAAQGRFFRLFQNRFDAIFPPGAYKLLLRTQEHPTEKFLFKTKNLSNIEAIMMELLSGEPAARYEQSMIKLRMGTEAGHIALKRPL